MKRSDTLVNAFSLEQFTTLFVQYCHIRKLRFISVELEEVPTLRIQY